MDEPPQQPLVADVRYVGRGRKRLLVLDDGREFIFSEEACQVVGNCGVGATADEALLSALDTAEQRVTAHAAALRLLSSRARSRSEMRTRLAMRGLPAEIVDEEIERLARAGLLNDDQFARSWVEDRKRLSPRGRRMLRYELLGRGIEPESVDQVTRDIDDTETALELARSRARGSALDSYDKFVTRVGGFLQRRGFDYAVTSHALRTVWAEVGGEGDPLEQTAESL